MGICGNLVAGTILFFITVAGPVSAQYYNLDLGSVTLDNIPAIDNLKVTPVRSTAVTITWDSNVEANTFLDYGETAAYGRFVRNPSVVVLHSVPLTGLYSSSLYHYAVTSTDVSGLIAYTDDVTFMTTPVLFAGTIKSTAKNKPCANCWINITMMGASNTTTTGSNGAFALNLYTRVKPGTYPTYFAITEPTGKTSKYSRRVSIS
jgi:hypothetical protein